MAQSFIQDGKVLTLVAPYARATSGLGAKVGGVFGVSLDTVANGAEGQFERTGVHKLEKTSAQAFTQGQRLFWDDTNKRLDSDPTIGMFVGYATEAAANPSSTGKVLLVPAGSLLEGAQPVTDIATADATDLASAITLANATKVKVNALLAALRINGVIS